MKLRPGETVLDLGSSGGINVLLSARRVGSTGKAYGLDITDEMLALAEENKRKIGLTNVEFLKGEIEHIPLPDKKRSCAEVGSLIPSVIVGTVCTRTTWSTIKTLCEGGAGVGRNSGGALSAAAFAAVILPTTFTG